MIPQEIADLTPAFFADALGRDVDCAELIDRHSGTTGRSRFRLSGDPALPATVFVKLAPFNAVQREFVAAVGMGVAEARFYRDLAREVPVRVPHPHYAETDGERYVMVLEDLEASGCRFPGPRDPDIERRGGDIVEQLAALHGKYWDTARFDDPADLGWLAGKGIGNSGGGHETAFVKMAVDNLGAQFDAAFHRIADFYLTHTPAILELWNSGPGTLVHGDPHIGNLFVDVRAGDRTGFLDWGFLGRSPGVRDVAYVLCNSIPAEVRAANEHSWLRRYRELLAECGVVLTDEEAWRQYRVFAVYSWVAAASTAGMASKWQPLHVGLAGTRRTTEACAHLHSVELLEELV
ncbi:phosphotransferase family protein [Mycobacterium sp. 852002-51163_SCH5372311]|uniref:phosphotransferase family protein n=1 Tax=Mycobacterium sp. 852002-51163_SCH5372311 TaxID=1834097 RepID=UPI0018D47D25|nr:aminoglycoside phosphotransferase family protein [Mycobacterium sp. 852002-51163_SCH5372311]